MDRHELTATVVGGGIAGLASAVALAQAGWRVTVLERAAAFGEVGAGLATTGNGMTALAALGLGQASRDVAYQTGTAGLQDQAGRWIMRMPDTRSDPAIYWYGYFRHPEGAVFPDELAAARERFADWAPWIRRMVTATPAERGSWSRRAGRSCAGRLPSQPG